jgi:hypothetical protein
VKAVLADPQGMFSMATALGPDEVVAVVDLSQTESEARDEATAASRSGTREGLRSRRRCGPRRVMRRR